MISTVHSVEDSKWYTTKVKQLAPEIHDGWKVIASYWEGNFSGANC